jgi:ABC-type multidrug transport system ATPase subunit
VCFYYEEKAVSQMKLTVRNLCKNYGSKEALKDVSFNLEEGIYGLLGPNGSGKTTLMNILTGNLKATSGEALWNDESIFTLGEVYREILGYVPQQSALYPEFTVTRYLFYMAALQGMEKQEATTRVKEALEAVKLTDEAKKKIKTLSGGMKQRLLIAQSILHGPKLLIMDEPTAGLDPYQRSFLVDLIKRIATDRIVLFSTHIVSDIELISNEVLLLKEGVLLKKNTASSLINEIKDNKALTPRDPLKGYTLEDVYLYFFGEAYVEDSML